jgi:polysaccharide pyruvyl transferase WcaK-like protein
MNGMVHLTDVVPILPAMVRKTFSILDAVAVREACSLRNLEAFAPDVDARVFPDSAFVLTADDALDTPAVRAIRDQIGEAPYFCFDPGAMPMDHRGPKKSALYELITALQKAAPRAVLVNSAPADRYIEQIAAETGAIFVDTLTDYREYMTLVRDAQFVASGRYHNPILAAIMGCPSLAFGSTNHKVHGASEMLEVVGSPHDGTDLRPRLDVIEEQARAYVRDRGKFRDELQELCRRLRSEAFELGGVAAGALRTNELGASAQAAEVIGR